MWIMIAGPYRSGANSDADREQNLAILNRYPLDLFIGTGAEATKPQDGITAIGHRQRERHHDRLVRVGSRDSYKGSAQLTPTTRLKLVPSEVIKFSTLSCLLA